MARQVLRQVIFHLGGRRPTSLAMLAANIRKIPIGAVVIREKRSLPHRSLQFLIG
jgi:hypothetical protein